MTSLPLPSQLLSRKQSRKQSVLNSKQRGVQGGWHCDCLDNVLHHSADPSKFYYLDFPFHTMNWFGFQLCLLNIFYISIMISLSGSTMFYLEEYQEFPHIHSHRLPDN